MRTGSNSRSIHCPLQRGFTLLKYNILLIYFTFKIFYFRVSVLQLIYFTSWFQWFMNFTTGFQWFMNFTSGFQSYILHIQFSTQAEKNYKNKYQRKTEKKAEKFSKLNTFSFVDLSGLVYSWRAKILFYRGAVKLRNEY